jgi:lysophospholipase L1-like esterase
LSGAANTRTWLTRLAFAVLSPLAFLAIVECACALAGAGDPDPFFVQDRNDPSRMQRHPAYRQFFASPPPGFLKEKPRNGFRVAVVGESTVAGYPFFYATFCDRLALALADVLPDRTSEVINAGVVGWTTFRLLPILDQCIQQKPDAIVWMVGHNEERSADNVLRLRAKVLHRGAYRISEILQSFHLTRWMASLKATGILTFSASMPRSQPRLGPEAGEIRSEFAEGLRLAVEKARRAGAKLILTTMPRNGRTLGPTGSGTRPGLSEPEIQSIQTKLARAEASLQSGRLDDALRTVDEALAIDTTPADLHFLKAKILERLGRPADARTSYIESMERDFWPSRAREWTQRAIREAVAAGGATLVDLQRLFDENGACGVAGAEWLCDDVHPNLEGHRVIADALLHALANADIPVETSQFRFDRLRDEAAMRRAFGTPELEAFTEARALGYTKLFEAFLFPEGERARRAAAAREACERLGKAHDLVPGDSRVSILLGTAEILAGEAARGATRLRAALESDRGAAFEFARIVDTSTLLVSELNAAQVDTKKFLGR